MRAKSRLEVRIRSEACVCSEARVYSELCLNKILPCTCVFKVSQIALVASRLGQFVKL